MDALLDEALCDDRVLLFLGDRRDPPRSPLCATFPRMFSSSADEVFKIPMFAYLARRPSKSLKDWVQCVRQLNFKNRLRPTGITISFIRSLEAHSWASKYYESTPRSQVNLRHDSSRARWALAGHRTPLG